MNDDEVPIVEIVMSTLVISLCLSAAAILLLRHLCGGC